MADYADYKFLTAPTIIEASDPVMGPIIHQKRASGKTIHVLKKWMTVACPAAEAEIRTDFTTLFDGVATPIIIAIDSSDNTQDKAGGTGALTASMLKTTSAHVMAEEGFTLNGTTVVDGVTLNEHLNDMKCLTYGTDGEPTGTIQAINHADNAVYAKIANTGHCTINARTYIPAGYAGYIVVNAKASYISIPSEAAGITANEGATVRFRYVTLDAAEPLDLALYKRAVVYGQVNADVTPPLIIRPGGTDEYVTVLVDRMDNDIAGSVSLEWTILMWT